MMERTQGQHLMTWLLEPKPIGKTGHQFPMLSPKSSKLAAVAAVVVEPCIVRQQQLPNVAPKELY